MRIPVCFVALTALWQLVACNRLSDTTTQEQPPSTPPAASTPPPPPVDDARLLAADKDQNNWLAHGRTYDEQRFSPLNQITRAT